jgi:hypothetical protein
MEFGYFSDKALPRGVLNMKPDGARYTLNSHGYRCAEWTPMPDGKKNVAVFGCSHTFGQGLNDDEHWVHFLSQHNTDRLRYWNLAQPGSSGDKVVRTLYGSEKIIDPRIVIVCWPDWSRRERFERSPINLPGDHETLRYETDDTDLNNFLKNVFFVEKYGEKNNCKVFHCFAQESYHAHLRGLNVLEEQTVMNCWPWWHRTNQRLAQPPSLARDGQHYGVKHHERFAKIFLTYFGKKLK